MSNHRQQHGYIANNAGGFFAGLLLGGLIGAGAMLLMAPQSGEKTLAKIKREGRGLRNQVSDAVDEVVLPVRSKARRVMADVRRQAKDLEQQGQDVVDEQEEIVSDVVDAEKKLYATPQKDEVIGRSLDASHVERPPGANFDLIGLKDSVTLGGFGISISH